MPAQSSSSISYKSAWPEQLKDLVDVRQHSIPWHLPGSAARYSSSWPWPASHLPSQSRASKVYRICKQEELGHLVGLLLHCH